MTTALGLFSGGLDSILACRVVAEQGVRVIALKFVTPFFDSELLERIPEYALEVKGKYGLDVKVVDLSQGYLQLLHNPAHGFGKHFNPCIDCKILMLSRARALLDEYQASFLITGEVLGQRPMSQRRDTLRVIERESGCEDILLRPLSAKLMKQTRPEREGLVDRDKLYAINGRGRKPQMALARKLGINEYPNAAGGCILTDLNLASRIEKLYNGSYVSGQDGFSVNDVHLLLVGRQFRLSDEIWFVLGRNQEENERLEALRSPEDWLFRMPERPGPTGLLRNGAANLAGSDQEKDIIRSLGGLVVRYGKRSGGKVLPGEVHIDTGDAVVTAQFDPLDDIFFRDWQVR